MRTLRFVLPLLLAARVAAQSAISVTNTSQIVDGNTLSMFALQLQPGPDGGVSFAEAVEAANNTPGTKSIGFAPSLKGRSIPLGSDDPQQFFFVTIRSGDLTIDGDIDGDHAPDVTLDATNRPYGAGIDIRSSNVTINGLHVIEAGNAILFACTDEACAPRAITPRTSPSAGIGSPPATRSTSAPRTIRVRRFSPTIR